MRSLTRREQIGIGVLMACVLVVGWFYVLLPEYRRWRAWGREVRVNQRKIREARSRAGRLPTLEAQIRTLKTRLNVTDDAESTPASFHVLRRLQRSTEQARIPPEKIVRLARVGPKPDSLAGEEESGGEAVARFRSITMENLVRLIWGLASERSPGRITRLRMAPAASGGGRFYDVTLRISVAAPMNPLDVKPHKP